MAHVPPFPKLKNNPLTEVSARIVFGPEQPVTAEYVLPDFLDGVFSVQRPLTVREQTIDFDKEVNVGIESRIITIGNRFISSEGYKSLIVSNDSIQLEYNKFYSDFESFTGELLSVWNSVTTQFEILEIKEIIFSFKNRFSIALPFESSEYFNLDLILPESWDFGIFPDDRFDLTIKNSDTGMYARIHRRLHSHDGKQAQIYFNLAVINPRSFEAGNQDRLSKIFSDIRKFKNKIFFSSFTEKTIQLFR